MAPGLPDLEGFNRSRGPVGHLTALTLVIFVLLAALWVAAAYAGRLLPPLLEVPAVPTWTGSLEQIKGLVFLLYLSAFLALWVIYFSQARTAPDPASRLRSLRVLLSLSAWGRLLRSSDAGDAQAEAASTDPSAPVVRKSEATIATVALLAAAAVVELEQVSSLYSGLSQAGADVPFWQEVVLGLGALSAMAALVCLLISVDSLDSAVNDFGTGEQSWLLTRHFYLQAIQPKYLGFAALLAGAVFIVCFHSRTLASVSIGLILMIGYRHWFPTVQTGAGRLPAVGTATSVMLVALPLLVEPAVILFRHVDVPLPSWPSGAAAPMLALAAPVVAAVLWALSAPVINVGLAEAKTLPRIATGLLGSLTIGCAGLGLVVAVTGQALPPVDLDLILAGVLTFPVATGLYYVTGRAFHDRTDLAAVFAKVKPVFSLAASWWLLGEAWEATSYLAAGLISAGVLLLIVGQWRGDVPKRVLPLGLAAALAWAAGEYFIAVGGSKEAALGATFVALASGTAAAWIVATTVVIAGRRPLQLPGWRGAAAFAGHGLLSFAIAYTCFFYAIIHLGLGRTVIITAFWPALAIVAGVMQARAGGHRARVPAPVVLACVLLISASVLLGVTALR